MASRAHRGVANHRFRVLRIRQSRTKDAFGLPSAVTVISALRHEPLVPHPAEVTTSSSSLTSGIGRSYIKGSHGFSRLSQYNLFKSFELTLASGPVCVLYVLLCAMSWISNEAGDHWTSSLQDPNLTAKSDFAC